MSGGEQFAGTMAVTCPSYSPEQPSPSFLPPQGLLDQEYAAGAGVGGGGWAGGGVGAVVRGVVAGWRVGRWAFYTSWPR